MATLDLKPSGGDFDNLNAALGDVGTVASDIVEASGDWSTRDNTATAVVEDDNITIRSKVGDQARHVGFDDDGSNYALEVTSGHALQIDNPGCILEHFIIKQDGTGASDEGVRCNSADDTFTFKKMIIWADSVDTDQDGVYTSLGGTFNFEQCYIFGFERCGVHHQWTSGTPTGTINVNSCGIWDNGHSAGSAGDAGGGVKLHMGSGAWIVNIQNTWSCENDTGSGSNEDYHETGSFANITWNISNSIDSDNSIAGVGPNTGANNLASVALRDSPGADPEMIVNDISTAPFDLRLTDNASENDAQDVHTDNEAHGLTIPSTDIAGTARPQNTNHDIGPFEIVVVDAISDYRFRQRFFG